MKFELPPLPYAKEDLEPHMGRETLEFHYEKHHRGYLTKLQGLIGDKPEVQKDLEEIIRTSSGGVFNNAAQVWNHTFFWNCMQAKGGGEPGGDVGNRIRDAFGSWEKFCETFTQTGLGRFGSGYVWLVLDGGQIKCVESLNADNPMVKGQTPILTCDLWEHAYYLDHRNDRGKFLDTFLKHLVNWEYVGEQIEKSG